MSTGVSPRLCEPPTKMYSMIRKKKKNMMTSMSSLFLCGAVFVEVWLVDVGIADEIRNLSTILSGLCGPSIRCTL